MAKNKHREKKKRRIKYKNVFLVLGILVVIVIGIVALLSLHITNIYISGNTYLTDQEVIELAGLSNYPKTYSVIPFSLENKLEENIYIKDAKVTKKMFISVYITITENRPLFYNSYEEKTILLDGRDCSEKFNAPIVINYIPDTIYTQFVEEMSLVSEDIIERISEIKYDPNDVDEERFLLLMNNGNYVYLTLSKFSSINNYIDIVKKFGDKKGILYLDSGEYFKVLED